MAKVSHRVVNRLFTCLEIILWPRILVDYAYQRLLLGIAQNRSANGFSLYSVENDEQFFRIASEATLLLKSKDPIRYRRAQCYMPVIAHVRQGLNFYKHSVRAFYVHKPPTDASFFASQIVHEATHAYLRHRGFRYTPQARERHEQICTRQQLGFIVRLIQAQDHLASEQQAELVRQWKNWFNRQLSSKWWHGRVIRRRRFEAIKELLLELRRK